MNFINKMIKKNKIPESNEKNTMIFKMKENGRYIYIRTIKENVKWTECMRIYKSEEPLLFSIGDEMTVKKKGMQITPEMKKKKEMKYFHLTERQKKKRKFKSKENVYHFVDIR